jgi:hypothetical protein
MKLQLVKPGEPIERVGGVPEQLRKIADDIESGALIGVASGVVVLQMNAPGVKSGMMVYGIRDGDPVTRLEAAYMLLSLALRELERVAVAAND